MRYLGPNCLELGITFFLLKMRYHPMTLYSSHRLLQLGDLLLLLLLFLFTASGNITMERGASQEIGFQVVKSSKFHSFQVPIRCWSG